MYYAKNWFKFVLGFLFCVLVRLIPFRPPNIEPIMAVLMPFSKGYGKFAGFVFAFLSMILFDLVVGKVGIWTFVTAIVYGSIGFIGAIYLKNKENTAWNYTKFAIVSTIAFDILTGFTVGPLFFAQPLREAILGQIPFSLLHLLGNVSFAIVLSPALYTFVINNKKLESRLSFINFKLKNI